jgi:PAS domain S-box-containing protein
LKSDFGAQAALELFEAAPCGYLFSEPDGTITRVNQTFLRWTGYRGTDLLGRKRFQDLLSVPASIFYETHFAPLLRLQGFVREITVDVICANGSSFPALVNSTIQADAAGAPAFVRTTIFDIRERRRYERELLMERRKAEHLVSVVEDATDAIVTASADGTILTWNRSAERLFGYRAVEAVGQNLRDLLVSANQLDQFDSTLRRSFAGDAANYEGTLKNNAGIDVDVSISFTPHIEPPDELVGFSAIIRDLGEKKRTELALIRSAQLASIGRMAAALAHEINNPLSGAVNSVYLASNDPSIGSEARGNLINADLELQRVAHVTRQVLGFYRELSTPRLVSVKELLDSAVRTVEHRLPAKRITIEQQCDDSLKLTAIAGELRQVFSNLLLNSIDAAEDGKIIIRASRLETRRCGYVRVTIADTGIGIPRSIRHRIFEPLFTTKGSTSTGLGLWVSKEIVKRSRGSIRLRSQAGGSTTGTVVSVLLPMTSESPIG